MSENIKVLSDLELEKLNSLGGITELIEGAPEGYIGLDEPEIAGISKTASGLPIHKKITKTNKTKMGYKDNRFIVIHYVGAVSTAANNASYFYSEYRGASAAYFVDPYEIWQCVEDCDASWHCGGGMQSSRGGSFYKVCLNSNSIGIEMCMKVDSAGNAYFEEATIKNTIDLTRSLMKEYNIPIDRVIRHFDVVGKYCPGPWVDDESAWHDFKNRLVEDPESEYDRALKKLIKKGIIGDEDTWKKYGEWLKKSEAAAVIDNIVGRWGSDEANPNIHWAQPVIISLCGKGIIGQRDEWINTLNSYVSKGESLALVDNASNGMIEKYKDTSVDHWARRCLNSLCDKSIIRGISELTKWNSNFDGTVERGDFILLVANMLDD